MASADTGHQQARTGRRRRRRLRARAVAQPRKPRATAAERRQRIGVLWSKAQVAARSARLLSESGDTDGAVNRAYYATFGAARAALATFRYAQASSKMHGTIYRRFDKLFVQERGLDPTLGRSLFQKLSTARNAADYGKAQTSEETARGVVGEMDRFIASLEPFLNGAGRKVHANG